MNTKLQLSEPSHSPHNLCGVEASQVRWLRLAFHLGNLNPTLGTLQNVDARVVRHPHIEGLQRLLHLVLQAGNKGVGVEKGSTTS